MDDIEQKNKKHLNPKSGRKFRENSKIKPTEANKVDYQDSRGQSFSKTKKNVNKVNAKAFAIQNINKAKKKVSLVVDRQTSKHTFRTLSEQYLDAPQLIALVGPQNSGKSTLLRTLMRHYTSHRMTINGPVTVVTSKTKKVTFFECPNELNSLIDVAKTADMIMLMINVKQGIQNETFEFIELLNTHGNPRIKIIFTHLDEFNKHDKQLLKKMKDITKRIQMDVHALPFRLSEFKTFRTAGNSEYKIEEVKNLARLIGQKKPLPNEWRGNHPYVVVDRLEKVANEKLNAGDEFDYIKFYGYVRGCTMSSDIPRMHLMGVDDIVVDSVEPLNEPCPTPLQESKIPKKRQPLEIKERKAYAPMCGFGGVLKDSEGFHIISENNASSDDRKTNKKENQSSDEDCDDEDDNAVTTKSSLIREIEESDCSEDDEDDEDIDDDESEDGDSDDSNSAGNLKRKLPKQFKGKLEPASKKICKDDTAELADEFEDLQDDLLSSNNRINYERLIYDEEYASSANVAALHDLQNERKELSIDLFVTGKWDENEDALTLLKKDDANRKKISNGGDDEDEDDFEDDEYDDEDEEMGDEDDEVDEEDGEEDDEEMMEIGDEDDDKECENSDYEEYQEDSENDNEDDDDDDDDESDDEEVTDVKSKNKKESTDLFENLVPDTAALTDFQKKQLERDSKTKRQKKLEKKAKHKALFDNLYDQKQGGPEASSHFEKWKEANDQQEQKNKVAFDHLDNEDAYKITGIKPGAYVCIHVKKVNKLFYKNFSPKRQVILGGLAPGEESYAMLTASFKLSRHFDIKQVLKTKDPICMSMGWRRIQSMCYFFKEDDNLRKTYLKYSEKKGLFCKVAFLAPVVPVKTGFSAFIDFEHHDQFRVAGIGSVLSKDDSVDIKKKLKRIGEPAKIFNKTAFIKGMFSSELEVLDYTNSLLKTSSGIRGAVKKPLQEKAYGPGAFRATFEAQIFMSDLVSLTCWVTVPMMKACQIVKNLLVDAGETFPYWKLWNQYHRDNNIPLPGQKLDSKYKKITRKPFNPAPIKFSRKVIEKLPFINRPVLEAPEDVFQKNRPKVVLDAKESQKAQLVDTLLHTNDERRKKMLLEKQKYSSVKTKKMKIAAEKELEKKKKKSKAFFKNKSIKSGEAKRKPSKND